MLVDEVVINIKAGNGGNGSVHLKRNAQTAKGGPDGGNGGNGGNVYFLGIDDILGLFAFKFKKDVLAEDGVKGGRQNLFGRNGKDTIITIPIGTTVTDTNTKETWEATNTLDKILMAKGGKGGRGNNEFKTATNQTPIYAEKGGIGQNRELHLELKIIADIGLIGLPNAGKSSLLATLTNAKPKIGNYPFTTLEPNIGVLIDDKKRKNIILADIPGLIEGASNGKGLGIKFLRHVEKTKMLIHCIDSSLEDVVGTYKTVRKELARYSAILEQKQEIIVLTKIDLAEKETVEKNIKLLKKFKKEIITVSIYNPESLKLLQEIILKNA